MTADELLIARHRDFVRRDRHRPRPGHQWLLADVVASSVAEHARFGGVVPEIASRAHLESMLPTVEAACAPPPACGWMTWMPWR